MGGGTPLRDVRHGSCRNRIAARGALSVWRLWSPWWLTRGEGVRCVVVVVDVPKSSRGNVAPAAHAGGGGREQRSGRAGAPPCGHQRFVPTPCRPCSVSFRRPCACRCHVGAIPPITPCGVAYCHAASAPLGVRVGAEDAVGGGRVDEWHVGSKRLHRLRTPGRQARAGRGGAGPGRARLWRQGGSGTACTGQPLLDLHSCRNDAQAGQSPAPRPASPAPLPLACNGIAAASTWCHRSAVPAMFHGESAHLPHHLSRVQAMQLQQHKRARQLCMRSHVPCFVAKQLAQGRAPA